MQEKQSIYSRVFSAVGCVVVAHVAMLGSAMAQTAVTSATDQPSTRIEADAASPVTGEGLQMLAQFLKDTQSGSAGFTQTVRTAKRQLVATGGSGGANGDESSRVGTAETEKVSKGTLQFLRPLRLRMVYVTPYSQEIVVDGQKLWFFDKDLEQVSARPIDAVVVAQTPMAALLQARSVDELEKDFDVTAEGPSDHLSWVQLTPKQQGGQLQNIQLGLGLVGGEVLLKKLVSKDGFGQVTTLDLDYSVPEAGAAKKLTVSDFQFVVPDGVSVFE